ncbi:MAG: hypothetical protein QF560_05880 [SAR324 cluster bacterium]|nr:hypothetical protein [SAR324 cluster bacterium]MEE1577641.1 hypothetical protein [Deltaproteobacteria bacterium]MDP6248179.1 hypothetical protein [SAR324 cluster bacterium]MDP6465824.1 hypothetical protein [SAR324 cluster bacterium]MDP7137891.1 hypothetical protein [SAR324 cluster bacterium]
MPKASADFSPAAAISGKRGDQCITDQGAGTDVVTVFLRIAPRDGGLHR